jgi:hypothetical protein
MSLKQFAERTVRLDGRPFRLTNRPYLDDLYKCEARRIVIRASRQVEKSTFLVNVTLRHAVRFPGTKILFVCPRKEQARLFSKVRLAGAVHESPLLQQLLWSHQRPLPPVDIRFDNGSHVFVRSAYHTADAIRGISANLLLIDEFQDLAPGELPILEETLSHAVNGKLVLTATPKLCDNHLEASFSLSTACEWQVPCSGCQRSNILDESVLGLAGLVCAQCQAPLDSRHGRWIARNPDSSWGAGYWINHLMVPWLDYQDIRCRQESYDIVRFKNEVLGLPTTIGDHAVTREELEACCDQDRPFARSIADIPPAARPRLVAGLDWGGGGVASTLLVVGYIEPRRVFRVVRFDRWRPNTDPSQVMAEVARRCAQFRVQFIAADGGGFGRSHNRLLLDLLRQERHDPHIYSIFYSASQHEPVPEGVLWRWTVDRSRTIGDMVGRIKKGLLRFPRVAESGTFLDEFSCEVTIYDPHQRTHKYTKPDTLRDDALHATNYCELIGLRMPSP